MDENKKSIFQRVYETINNCPDEEYRNLNVGWMAKKLDVSESYLSRTFNEECIWPLRYFIEFEKMNKASDLVLRGDMTVKEIAEFFDYSSPHYFSRIFAEHWTQPPTEFRKKMERRRLAAEKARAGTDKTVEKKGDEKVNIGASAEETKIPEDEKPLLEIIKNRIIRNIKRKFSSWKTP